MLTGQFAATSAVDLTFASLLPRVRIANVKSKTALALNELLVFLWLQHLQMS